MNNFAYCKNEIKSRLDCRMVFAFYGIELNRSDFCACPFHSERTPSCKVYEKGYKCFGCGTSGDVIDFVGRLFNLPFKQAMEKINIDFCLNLPLDGEITPTQRRKAVFANAMRKVQKNKTDELEATYWKLYDEWVRLDKIKREQTPYLNNGTINVTTEYVYAVAHLPHIEFELDLLGGEISDRKRNK